jgi:hypothetical protein
MSAVPSDRDLIKQLEQMTQDEMKALVIQPGEGDKEMFRRTATPPPPEEDASGPGTAPPEDSAPKEDTADLAPADSQEQLQQTMEQILAAIVDLPQAIRDALEGG